MIAVNLYGVLVSVTVISIYYLCSAEKVHQQQHPPHNTLRILVAIGTSVGGEEISDSLVINLCSDALHAQAMAGCTIVGIDCLCGQFGNAGFPINWHPQYREEAG